MYPTEKFWQQAKSKRSVIEFGTSRWDASKPTHHKEIFVLNAGAAELERYIMADITPGLDVDLVCDLHKPPEELYGRFDCFLAASVWEHLKKPWVCAERVWDLLRPGGIFLVTTHQTFPIHGYPHDYFRFTKEALHSCFDTRPWAELEGWSGHECSIIPLTNVMPVWNFEAKGHIQSVIYGRKP